MEDFQASIDMAAALGAPVLTIVVGGVEAGTKGVRPSLDLVAERVTRMADVAASHGVKLALEPLSPVYGGNRSCLVTMRDAVDMALAIDKDNVGVAVDVYHTWWDTDLERQLVRLPAAKILGLHLCDWLADTTDVLLDRGMMGDGVADIRAIRRSVEACGYKGLCEVEIFSARHWWTQEPASVLDEIAHRFRTCC